MSKTKSLALILGVLIMSFLVGYLIFAWTEPTQAPPAGNVTEPLNRSSNPQDKPARLTFTEFYDYNNTNYYINPDGQSVLAGNVGIGDTTPASLFTVGSGDLFQVDSSGNIIKIRNVTYSWPSVQGGANTVLTNNGSGTLSWAAAAGGGAPTDATYVVASGHGSLTAERILTAGAGISVTDVAGNPGSITVANTGLLTTTAFSAAAASDTTVSGTYNSLNIQYKAGSILTADIADLAVTNPKISEMDWVKLQNYPATATCPANQFVTQIADAITCAAPPAVGGLWTDAGTYIYPNNYVNLAITDTGYLGVGTTTPDSNYKITTSGGGIKAEANIASQPAGYFSNSNASGYALVTYSGNVGIGTTGPEFRLTLDKGATTPDGGMLAIGTVGSGTSLTTSGAGTRLIWYPKKAAFRAGYVNGTQWNDANIGAYSTAMGRNTAASGAYSTAIGYYTAASGNYSTAMGVTTTASGLFSTAIGHGITAQGNYSVAIALNDQTGTIVSQANTMAIMGGNVGIGTTSPGGPLDVNGRAGATSFKVSSTFADLINNAPWYGIGQSNISLWTGQPTYYATQLAGYYGLNFKTANGQMVITGDTGNVGIGTTAPVAKLDILSATRSGTHPSAIKGLYVTGDFGEASDGVEFRHSNATQGIGFGYNTIYAAGTNANQHLNLMPKGTGNVGIGTTGPGYKLHVIGDIYANGGWLRTSGAAGWYSESYGGGWYMSDTTWIRAYNNKNIYTGGSAQFDGNLNVGGTLKIGGSRGIKKVLKGEATLSGMPYDVSYNFFRCFDWIPGVTLNTSASKVMVTVSCHERTTGSGLDPGDATVWGSSAYVKNSTTIKGCCSSGANIGSGSLNAYADIMYVEFE